MTFSAQLTLRPRIRKMSVGTETENSVDLVIVGGGPTGLAIAVLARSLGLSIRILDSKEGPLDLGRADALNARTQQYLEVSKTLDRLLPQGITCNTSSTFEAGEFTSRQSHWWTSLKHTFRPNFLIIGQPRVEAALLEQLDVPVDYDRTVISITESATGASVTTNKGETFSGKYVVAADGARSFVRTALDIPFTGTKPEMVWAVLDTFIETDFPVCPEIITFQVDGQARVAWIPRERGMSRFYILLDGEITQAKAEASVRAHMAPHKVDFVKTEWFSTFDIKERIAGTFISQSGNGRIVLAGDAAHVHAVNGGQGLNTGIADAFALTWRLGLAAKGLSGHEVLRSYDTERRAVAASVIEVAALLVRSTIKTALEYVDAIERNAGYITGMGVSYPSGTLVRESEFGEFVAGHRCPDLTVTALSDSHNVHTGEERRMYTLFQYGKFVVLFLGDQAGSVSATALQKYQQVAEFWNIHADDKGIDSEVPEYQARWVENQSGVVVIRPDFYTGYAGEKWEEYLDELLTATS
ncbi:monooxygenase [Aspergillus steynii IBT 23096]|uniref:Monooxygenase n=1 Tax=Aspergillus steynii IBT 23096 TaxID=1392250 RepID=A0A2I2GA70_9EURO|nr:monooxygenase [Aspergillus steynii IBT 23096]PLB49768.1 monooxygenase [Aspergillus steynii IBT 23096]